MTLRPSKDYSDRSRVLAAMDLGPSFDVPLPVALNRLVPVKGVRLIDGDVGPSRLEWQAGEYDAGRPATDCLAEFLKLGAASDAKILAFARKYGVLGLCPHGRPATHPTDAAWGHCAPLAAEHRAWEPRWLRAIWMSNGPARDNEEEEGDSAEADDDTLVGPRHWEPVAAWRCYALALRALLDIAMRIEEGGSPRAEVWRQACIGLRILDASESGIRALANPATWDRYPDDWPSLTHSAFAPAPDQQAERLCRLVDVHLRDAGLVPRLSVKAAGKGTEFRATLASPGLPVGDVPPGADERMQGGSLFAVLVAQLVDAIQSRGKLICSECGNPFGVPEGQRRPRRDRSRFCTDACRDESDRTRNKRNQRSVRERKQGGSRPPRRDAA